MSTMLKEMAPELVAVLRKKLRFTLDYGPTYEVPVSVIATHRAQHYEDEFGGDLNRSLLEDTLPLFAEDEFAIRDWAGNNMEWSDVKAVAHKVAAPKEDPSLAWYTGNMEIVP